MKKCRQLRSPTMEKRKLWCVHIILSCNHKKDVYKNILVTYEDAYTKFFFKKPGRKLSMQYALIAVTIAGIENNCQKVNSQDCCVEGL